jgi:16S rRNA (cytosine967-C5)-methyltransferase
MKITPVVIRHIEQLLKDVLQFKGPADVLVSRYFRSHPKLGMRDRGAVAESIYRVLRNRLVYSNLSESGKGPRERRLALIALSDIYGIDALNGIDEAEKAWLEHIATIDRTSLPEKVRANLPPWLFTRLVDQYGQADTWALVDVLNTPAPLDLRVNVLKGRRDDVLSTLKEAGVDCAATPFATTGIRLSQKVALQDMPVFKNGTVEVQDEGSQLLAQIVGARRGELVVDFCAGAGGKTLALGAAMKNTGRLYAYEVSEKRLANMKPRLARSGLSNVHPIKIAHEHDARIKRLARKADRVLVDSPCSGMGTLRRNPDLKWRQNEEAIAELGVKQREILASAARLVKPGGRLIYATCSLLTEENEQVVSDFLAQDPRFKLVPMSQVLAEAKVNLEMGDYLKLLPHKHGTDGFFAAVLERTE